MNEFIKIECPETTIYLNKQTVAYGQIFNDGGLIFVLNSGDKFEIADALNINQIEESFGYPKGHFNPRVVDD